MSKIFISYRRNDSQYVTDAIYLQFKGLFGEANVFLDVGNIPFGVDFRQYLREQIEAHDVVLVIIGPDWAKIMKERAEQANDFVRIEVENALKLGKLVIPVLVMNAAMPDFSDLPASIADLQWRNSAQIRRHPDLEGDCKRLADGIKAYFASQKKAQQQQKVVVSETTKPQQTPPSVIQAHKPVEKPTAKPVMSYKNTILPEPFDWCEIPLGKVRLVPSFYTDYLHKGKAEFTVPRFLMSKYPITNAQFKLFVESGSYSDKWWIQEGWFHLSQPKWTEPAFWKNEKFNNQDQPIVGVSWYEAIGFCLWLSKRTGKKITLPTEQQWQRAAQGDDNFVYPWGNDFDKNKANVKESGIGKTTPVTSYSEGISPYGVYDMSGNVWEWCLTDPTTGGQDYTHSYDKIVRGGSWASTSAYAEVVFRKGVKPANRDYNNGFRICTEL